MIDAALLVLVLASNQGYWLAGQTYTIDVSWNLEDAAAIVPEGGAVMLAELRIGERTLAKAEVALAADRATVVRVEAPKVRVRTRIVWAYRIVGRQDQQEIARGEAPLEIFPDNLLQDAARRLGARKLVVWDRPEGLPAILDRAGVAYERVDSAGKLAFARPDLVLVGAEALIGDDFEQARLVSLAEGGAGVMIFRQAAEVLTGYPLLPRAVPERLAWREEHPLLDDFAAADLASWLELARRSGEPLRAVALPADEPALELAWWPREVEGQEAAPTDAALVTRTVGRGRIVLCQIPLGAWGDDPRSQLLLDSALDYLMSRPTPTPAPSQRPRPREAEVKPQPAIALPGE